MFAGNLKRRLVSYQRTSGSSRLHKLNLIPSSWLWNFLVPSNSLAALILWFYSQAVRTVCVQLLRL